MKPTARGAAVASEALLSDQTKLRSAALRLSLAQRPREAMQLAQHLS